MRKKKQLYEDRIVVFIDILGFKKIIESTVDSSGNEIVENSHRVLHLLNLPETIFKEHPEMKSTKIVTQFSDSVVISFNYTEESQVFYTLLDILHLQLEMVMLGQIARGALCFGKLYHTRDKVFGPGMVKAYEFETQSAIFPRVVIDEEVLRVGERYAIDGHTPEIEREHLRNLAIKDFDGHYYVDYFSKAQGELDYPDLQWPEYLEKMKEIIVKGLKVQNAGVRNKYMWMAEKYNVLIKRYKDPGFIKSIGEHAGPEFSEFYDSLEEIEY